MDKLKVGYPVKINGTAEVPNRPGYYWIKVGEYPLAVFNRTVANLDISHKVIIKEVNGILEIERALYE